MADIPDLQSCAAFGATAEAALREVLAAEEAWAKTCRAKKLPVPKPRYRPAICARQAA